MFLDLKNVLLDGVLGRKDGLGRREFLKTLAGGAAGLACALVVCNALAAPASKTCPTCAGSGQVLGNCAMCNGTGKSNSGNRCQGCGGTGKRYKFCSKCGGSGTVK